MKCVLRESTRPTAVLDSDRTYWQSPAMRMVNARGLQRTLLTAPARLRSPSQGHLGLSLLSTPNPDQYPLTSTLPAHQSSVSHHTHCNRCAAPLFITNPSRLQDSPSCIPGTGTALFTQASFSGPVISSSYRFSLVHRRDLY